MSEVTITVGLPVFNGAAYLDETMQSILAQDASGMELVISDNGSTDETSEIVASYESDPRVRSFRREDNGGAAWNFNRVLELAEGEFFHWSGHDDLMDPTMLRKCVEALREAPDASLAYPRTILIDAGGQETGEYDNRLDLPQSRPHQRLTALIENLRLANPIFGVFPTVAIRTVGGLGSYPSADIVTLARLALRGPFIELDEPLFFRRMHDAQSWQQAGGYEGFARWFDTSNTSRIVFTNWRLWRELIKSSFEIPDSFTEKVRCAAVVLWRWPRRRWRQLIGELTRTRLLFRPSRQVQDSS